MRKPITILGSTGSIGRSTVDIVRQFPERFPVIGISCHSQVALLMEQIHLLKPKIACVANEEQAEEVRAQLNGLATKVVCGDRGLREIATASEVELVVSGIVGAAGLRPTYAAIESGKDVALANKEPMVLAGKLMVEKAAQTGSRILPTDSEHNAIFQSLVGHRREDVSSVILTASGGPFRDWPLEDFHKIQLADALKHPSWEMGPKITIDSATMMNKGLEVIEAHWLFQIPVSQIEVVIHRQSIVHSLVRYCDGSLISQMGPPDMRIPIAYCLGYPERLPLELPQLKLAQQQVLQFEEVPYEKFPCLQLALKAVTLGGSAPAVLNGANEAVVEAYLQDRFLFTNIARYLEQVLQQLQQTLSDVSCPDYLQEIQSIDGAIAADQWGRHQAQRLMP